MNQREVTKLFLLGSVLMLAALIPLNAVGAARHSGLTEPPMIVLVGQLVGNVIVLVGASLWGFALYGDANSANLHNSSKQ